MSIDRLLEIISELSAECAKQRRNADLWYTKYTELESRSVPIKKIPEAELCQTVTD
jgi:hypothetical protein